MAYTEQETSDQIRTIEIVSGHPRVAIRLIELSKDPEAELEDYSALIETDAGLASRMLALVNSAWFAPTHPVQTVKRAVCTLGLGQVRVVALSHCVASLHKSIKLNKEDSRAMWAASMCKAIAARMVCESLDAEHAQEAFTIALLQDLGLALFSSIDQDTVSKVLQDVQLDTQAAAAAEIAAFGMTHADAGARMAKQLVLPNVYAMSIAEHHSELPEESEARTATEFARWVAALLPHDIRYWNTHDMESLRQTIEGGELPWASLETFMQVIQEEFVVTDEYLNDGLPSPDLMECLSYASEENARAASVLVAQNSSLMMGTGKLQAAVDVAEHAKRRAETRADKDPLTDLFNRNGWDRRAKLTLRQAQSSSSTIGMAFLDLDLFKEINDTHGHQIGDLFLGEIGERIKDAVRAEDLVCRWGGDEFVILFRGADEDACMDALMRVKSHIESAPVELGEISLTVSTSVGYVVVNAGSSKLELETLLKLADENLYRAKENDRGSIVAAVAN
jgi:diguanylate cyclase (GGDEF)-like protein